MLLLALAIGVISARAQSLNTTIQFNQKMQPSLVLELPNTTDDVEGTILKKLKQKRRVRHLPYPTELPQNSRIGNS